MLSALDPEWSDALLAEVRRLREEAGGPAPSAEVYRLAEVRQLNAIKAFAATLAGDGRGG